MPRLLPATGLCHRPWGWFETLAEGAGYLVKRITILPGHRLSLQRHRHRCEHWVVVAGEGLLEVDGQRVQARPGSTMLVPVGAVHRAAAGRDGGPLVILEVQRGERLVETDIERFADDYGRTAGMTVNVPEPRSGERLPS